MNALEKLNKIKKEEMELKEFFVSLTKIYIEQREKLGLKSKIESQNEKFINKNNISSIEFFPNEKIKIEFYAEWYETTNYYVGTDYDRDAACYIESDYETRNDLKSEKFYILIPNYLLSLYHCKNIQKEKIMEQLKNELLIEKQKDELIDLQAEIEFITRLTSSSYDDLYNNIKTFLAYLLDRNTKKDNYEEMFFVYKIFRSSLPKNNELEDRINKFLYFLEDYLKFIKKSYNENDKNTIKYFEEITFPSFCEFGKKIEQIVSLCEYKYIKKSCDFDFISTLILPFFNEVCKYKNKFKNIIKT